MKKSVITVCLAGVLTLGISVAAFASDSQNNQSNGKFKGNNVSCVQKLMDEGKTFDEAKQEMLQNAYDRIDKQVQDGKLTADEATKIKDDMKQKSDACASPEDFKGLFKDMGLNGKGHGDKGFKVNPIQKLMDEGKTFDEAKQEMLQNAYDRIDKQVQDGKLTADEATKIKDDMKQKSDACTSPEDFKGFHENMGLNGKGHGDKEFKVNPIQKLMDEGKTFDEAKQEILQNAYDRIDKQVQDGKLTADEATKIKDDMKQKSDACTSPEDFKGFHENMGLNSKKQGNKGAKSNNNKSQKDTSKAASSSN